MRLPLLLSTAVILSIAVPAQAALKCKCTHIPIKPKRCVDRCLTGLVNKLSSTEMESILGLEASTSHDIVAMRNAGRIESLASLRSELSADQFQKIEAAASGDVPEPQALGEQLAALAPEAGGFYGRAQDGQEPPGDQIAALEGQGTDVWDLPDTASAMPLLCFFGVLSLLAGFGLRSYRTR